ncbi:ESCRT-II subunit protein snf8 [Cyanidiococcus yangmingshanensis]|uniref:ESCRT-II subunit protein snf8 n=1 Tax=Cyanidiococcus yangmingshanensis TaxID=2690220 RepID=A0A7J7ILR5_9RHOD|nr:ESCRT-II subunit protein snf8 [Cyanidiococcus yangmingshanensis]
MHSRRRYQGVAAIINQRLGAEQYAAAASSYLAEKEAALREQCVVFQEKLQEFAAEHQHEIENNTALRARFLELCMNMGWYARLGFLVAQIALATRDWNGGVIRLTTLRRALQRRLDAQSKRSRQVSTEDIVRAVQTLDTLQAGFRILVVDDKKHDRYLVSGAASQVSFTADEKAVLQRARETGWPGFA